MLIQLAFVAAVTATVFGLAIALTVQAIRAHKDQ